MHEAKFWNWIAEKYAKSAVGDIDAYEYTLTRTRSHLNAHDSVLEVGTGTGTTALALASSVSRILATDISTAMIEIGRTKAADANASNVDFQVASTDSLPEGPFDAVLGFNLLHLLRDLDGALAEISARVKPGGYFISKTICLADPGAPWKMRAMLLGLPLLQVFGRAPYLRKFSVSDLETAITRAAFEIIETGNYPDNPPRRFIVARKRG